MAFMQMIKMTTKSRLIGGVILVLIATAFVAGYWPQRQRWVAAEADNAFLRSQVASLEDRVRLARLHGELLNLIDAVTAMNYGQAQTLSSAFFDNVRDEAGRTQNADFRAALQNGLGSRDEVTGALAKGDPSILEALRRLEQRLREVLGYSRRRGVNFRDPVLIVASARS